MRQCSWLNNKTDLLKVINQLWSPAYEATKYLAEAEVLPDFEAHLEGGIEELKHSSINTDNVLTLINEISQLSENNVSNTSGCQDDNFSDNHIILTNIAKESDFLNQIYKIYKKLNKEGRHPVGRNGIYHILGLVKFTFYKWLNKIKSRKNEPGKIQLHTYAMPTTYSKSMAKNELFSIINKDHASQQSKELIASLLIWWSNTHHEINQKAKTNS